MCLIGLMVASVVADELEHSSRWPGFLGENRDGMSTERGIRLDWTAGQLPVVWKIDSADGYGIGSVADGKYCHFDSVNGLARLRCLNAHSGTEVWRFEYPSDYQDMYGYDSGPRASPLIDEDRLYIYGVEGMLHCLNVKTGEKLWSVDTIKRFGVVQNFFGVGSSPIIHDNLLLVMVGGSPEASQAVPPGALDRVQSNGSGVVAFDKVSGKIVYKTIDDLASYSSIQLVAGQGPTVALAWMRNRLYGFEPVSGKELFQFPWRSRKLESVNAMTPVVNQAGDVFISDCYEKGGVLIRLDDSGQPEIKWSDSGKRDKSMTTHWNTPVLIKGHLYGCSGRHSSGAELRCVDLNTGAVRWSKSGLGRTTATAVDGYLVVLGERGDLRLVKASPNRYEEVTRWECKKRDECLEYPAWAAPIVADGRMYVRGKNQLICFQLSKKPVNKTAD